MCVCGMMILPETQGKTLTELSEIYSAKEKKPSVQRILKSSLLQ